MRRVAAVSAAIALFASGCSLGERTAYATRLVESPSRAASAGTAVGTMQFDLSITPVNGGADTGAGAGGAGPQLGTAYTPPPAGEVPVVLDFAQQRASISLARIGGAPEPVVVIDGTRMFVRRGSTGGISARRWVVLDLATLDEVSAPDGNDLPERTGLLLVAFPGPLHLVELLAGSLTGSVDQRGPGTYAVNLSREKADRELDLDDEAIELRTNALTLVAIRDEVHPAEIVLDDAGRPTSVDVRLRPRMRRDFDIEVRIRTNLTYQPATVEIPPPEDTLAIETEGQLIAELVNLGRALAGETEEASA